MALKKIDPTSVFKTCSSMDPAIDKEATGEENFDKFGETYDMKLLKFKEGQFPTVFHLKNVLSMEEAKIKQEHLKMQLPELSENELKSVNLEEMAKKVKMKQVKGQEMVVKYFDAAIDTYEEEGKSFPCTSGTFPFLIVQEMGSLVMMRSAMGDDLKND